MFGESHGRERNRLLQQGLFWQGKEDFEKISDVSQNTDF